MNPIYERIKEAFATKNSAEIARQLGFGKHLAYRWRDGVSLPTTETLLKIYELTGCSLHWLLTGEGEKHPSKTVTGVTKKLASRTDGKDTPPAPILIPGVGLPTAQHELQPVPLHATISPDGLMVSRRSEATVLVPGLVIRDGTVLITIQGNDLAAEGLHNGDMLIAIPATGDLNGKLVIAIYEGKPIIREYTQRGNWALFSALEGNHPVLRFSATKVQLKYEITSLIHNFNK